MLPDTGAKILIVDDEPQIRRFLRASLGAHDYAILEAANAKEGIRLCTVDRPDLIVLDLGLPDMDGLDVISQIREWSQVPIIVLSVRSEEADTVGALDRGADDYVTKPFGMAELLARIRATLRRRLRAADESPVFSAGKLSIDVSKREVSLEGRPIHLTRKEYELLRILAAHAGRVVTHQQLLRRVWGEAHAQETQYLRVYVGQIRHKLGDDPANPAYILTEPGVGYRLREPD